MGNSNLKHIGERKAKYMEIALQLGITVSVKTYLAQATAITLSLT